MTPQKAAELRTLNDELVARSRTLDVSLAALAEDSDFADESGIVEGITALRATLITLPLFTSNMLKAVVALDAGLDAAINEVPHSDECPMDRGEWGGECLARPNDQSLKAHWPCWRAKFCGVGEDV